MPLTKLSKGLTRPDVGLLSFRNKIINGNFDIWQRGNTVSIAGTSVYGPDRWCSRDLPSMGASSATWSKQSFTPGQTEVEGEPEFYARLSVTGASEIVFIDQRIENVRTLSGKTVTASFYLRSSIPGTCSVVGINNYGGGSYENAVGENIEVTQNWQKFTVNIMYPSVLGHTLLGGNSNYFRINCPPGSPVIDIARVQLEIADYATPFEDRPLGLEKILCYRYFYNFTVSSTRGTGGVTGSGNIVGCQYTLPVTMRTTPTLSTPDTAPAYYGTGGWATVGSTVYMIAVSDNVVGVGVINAAIGVQEDFLWRWKDPAGFTLFVDAEL